MRVVFPSWLDISRCCLAATFLFLAASKIAHGQADELKSAVTLAPTNAPLREISPGVFQVGRVTLNKPARTVTFPAVLNMNEAAIEYLVVTDSGKIHESVLRTEAEPFHINLALLLLGVKGAGTNDFPTNAPAIPGERVNLEVSWLSLEKEVRVPAEQLVQHRPTGKPLSKGPWVYNGSRVSEGTFMAQAEGSVIAVMLDPFAIINNPRPEAEQDDLWLVNTNGLPPLNWPVEVTIRVR